MILHVLHVRAHTDDREIKMNTSPLSRPLGCGIRPSSWAVRNVESSQCLQIGDGGEKGEEGVEFDNV